MSPWLLLPRERYHSPSFILLTRRARIDKYPPRLAILSDTQALVISSLESNYWHSHSVMPALSVNPLIPRGRGGGGGGGSHGSSSNGGGGSSSGSTYNGYGSETGSSSGSSGSGYSSSSYKGSGSGSKSTSSTLAIWALVLLITLACIGLIFKISLIYYYRQGNLFFFFFFLSFSLLVCFVSFGGGSCRVDHPS